MSNIQTGAERMPHDLSHLGFLAGQIGRLITISTTLLIAGDSFEMDAVGALRLSPLRLCLAIDSTVDIFSFYVPHHHVYGEQCIKFMKDGVNATPLPTVNTTGYIDHAAFLGTINPDTNKIPKHLFQGYLNIYNNYFTAPWMPDRTQAHPNELNQDDARYGVRCCHLTNIWTAPLPAETELSRHVITSCSGTMMLFLHLEVKPLMTRTTVLYLSCALISGHLAMMLMELTKRRKASFLVVFNRPINILCRVSLFLSMALCLLLRLFVFRLLRLKRFSTLTLKVLSLIQILLATLFCVATCRRVKFLFRMFSVLVIRRRSLRLVRVSV